jgi:hypothetical protein
MKPNTPEQQAPESYATFWEPLAASAPVPTERTQPAPGPAAPAKEKDAYLEFVNVTEGGSVPARTERV